jgi:enamine deaminase RidA (YjgF/YER057c/UK114 family)
MAKKQRISPAGTPESDELEETGRGMVSPGILYNDALYLSGLVSRDENREVYGDDTETQTCKIFENLGMFLEEAGKDYSDVVKAETFFLDVEEQFPTFKKVWMEYFEEPYPCHSAYEISKLAHEDLLLEVEVVVPADD